MTVFPIMLLSCGKDDLPEERNVTAEPPFALDTGDTLGGKTYGLDPGQFYGTVEVTGSLPTLEASCKTTYEIIGDPYTGVCDGCTFNFEVTSTKILEQADCPTPDESFLGHWVASYTYASWKLKVLLGFHPDYQGVGYYGNKADGPTLFWGVNYLKAPYAWPFIYQGSEFGAVFNDNGTLHWSLDWEFYYEPQWPNVMDLYCGVYDISYTTGLYADGSSVSDDVDCAGVEGDIWAITLDKAETGTISVDTTGDSTAFEPWFWVNDGASCTTLVAFDNAECSHGGFLCPSAAFSFDAGEYQVVVHADDITQDPTCAGGAPHGAYTLTVDLDSKTDPQLVLVEDDHHMREGELNTLSGEGMGFIIE